jgi:hypothetical protein
MTASSSTRHPDVQDTNQVRPSKVDSSAKPFTLDQELKPFGTWVNDTIWVPPKDTSKEMAESMLKQPGLFTPMAERWEGIVESHRDSFTQVREIELNKASIRLPKGRLFVSITERENFDSITDTIPACVQTRLDEFLAGPGAEKGVNVYYLKPLCIEVDDDLHFTCRKDIIAAMEKIQQEVFAQYNRLFCFRRSEQLARKVAHCLLAVPREIANYAIRKRKRALDNYQAQLEFN